MKDLYYNDMPFKDEIGKLLSGDAFAGEYEPVTLAVLALADLGKVTVTASDLRGEARRIPASVIDVGFVSYRISRVTMEGSVYTIAPRLIMPANVVEMPQGIARRFWLTVRVPADAKAGVYKGTVAVRPEKGAAAEVPIEFRVRAGRLDRVDIPAGPWGYTIGIPWGDDPLAAACNREMAAKTLRKMREYGFTAFSGMPAIAYEGFRDGKPVLDFGNSDAQMKLARDLGFQAVVSYGSGIQGLNGYYQDTAAMTAAGFKDYAEFIRSIYSEVQRHADANGWMGVYYNIGDEPIGEDLTRSADNAEAYRRAFPKGPPYFTAASSFTGSNKADPHFRLSKALHVADWNVHDKDSVNLIHQAGGEWAFYNGGNRWTFGDYMYKAAKQFGMKFRLSWHWNAVAGDPYYALDCREDDYAWCNGSPDGQLIAAVEFERLREGLDDYRRLLTLARLVAQNTGEPASRTAEKLIRDRLGAFELGQRDHDVLFGFGDWAESRRRVNGAIEALRK